MVTHWQSDSQAGDTQGPTHRAAANMGDSVRQTGRNSCFSVEVPMASFNLTHFHKELHVSASLLEEGTGELGHATAGR